MRWGTRLACLEMLRGGITTFVDMYYFEDAIAEEAERCGMRAVVGETLIDFPAPDNETWEEAIGLHAALRRAVARDIRASRPLWLRTRPTPFPPSISVAPTRSPSELDVPMLDPPRRGSSARSSGVPARTGKTSVDYLDGLGILDDRVIAAHMVWPTATEIDPARRARRRRRALPAVQHEDRGRRRAGAGSARGRRRRRHSAPTAPPRTTTSISGRRSTPRPSSTR